MRLAEYLANVQSWASESPIAGSEESVVESWWISGNSCMLQSRFANVIRLQVFLRLRTSFNLACALSSSFSYCQCSEYRTLTRCSSHHNVATMAANFWASSQRLHWQMSRAKLAETRRALDAQDEKAFLDFPLPNYRYLSIYFNQRASGRALSAVCFASILGQSRLTKHFRRIDSSWSSNANPSASSRHSSSLCTTVLYQSSDP